MEIGSDTPIPLFTSDLQVVYAAPGYLLYMLGNTLVARGFDAASLRVTGEAIPIAEQVERNTASRRGAFTVSQTGVLAYRRPSESQLVWYHRDGRRLNNLGAPGHFRNPALSPDGTRVAVSQLDLKTGTWDIWLMEVATGRMSRVTVDGGVDDAPVWSPDGSRIAFKSDRDGEVRFYWKSTDSTGPDALLHKPPAIDGITYSRTLYGWLERHLVVWRGNECDRPRPLADIHRDQRPRFSGRGDAFHRRVWRARPRQPLAGLRIERIGQIRGLRDALPIRSDEVADLRGWRITARMAGRRQGVVLSGAQRAADGGFVVRAASSLEVDEPQRLFETGVSAVGNPNYTRNHYAVTSDGQRFLITQPAETHQLPPSR